MKKAKSKTLPTVERDNVGRRVTITDVAHAGMPHHDVMIGKTGTVRKAIASRNVYDVEMDSGGTWQANPENVKFEDMPKAPQPHGAGVDTPFTIIEDEFLPDASLDDKTQAVHHIDGNPRNNDLENLTIAPIPENLTPVGNVPDGVRAALDRRLLYRKVPGTNVSRADAVAYARKNWPFGALGRPVTSGFEWQQDSMRHIMSWEELAKD
jgi:hypothetical protein